MIVKVVIPLDELFDQLLLLFGGFKGMSMMDHSVVGIVCWSFQSMFAFAAFSHNVVIMIIIVIVCFVLVVAVVVIVVVFEDASVGHVSRNVNENDADRGCHWFQQGNDLESVFQFLEIYWLCGICNGGSCCWWWCIGSKDIIVNDVGCLHISGVVAMKLVFAFFFRVVVLVLILRVVPLPLCLCPCCQWLSHHHHCNVSCCLLNPLMSWLSNIFTQASSYSPNKMVMKTARSPWAVDSLQRKYWKRTWSCGLQMMA